MGLHEIDAAFFFIFTTLVTARAALATAIRISSLVWSLSTRAALLLLIAVGGIGGSVVWWYGHNILRIKVISGTLENIIVDIDACKNN